MVHSVGQEIREIYKKIFIGMPEYTRASVSSQK